MTSKAGAIAVAVEASAGRPIESYPIRLFAEHMAEIFGVSIKRFYAQDADGAYRWAENKPRIGRKSWSRDRVQAYFAGDVEIVKRAVLKRVS